VGGRASGRTGEWEGWTHEKIKFSAKKLSRLKKALVPFFDSSERDGYV
jgi:hypothetical protein